MYALELHIYECKLLKCRISYSFFSAFLFSYFKLDQRKQNEKKKQQQQKYNNFRLTWIMIFYFIRLFNKSIAHIAHSRAIYCFSLSKKLSLRKQTTEWTIIYLTSNSVYNRDKVNHFFLILFWRLNNIKQPQQQQQPAKCTKARFNLISFHLIVYGTQK